jgi:hypothetical protein
MEREEEDMLLMRLADGELTESEAAPLRARLAAEPALAARYAPFAATRRAAAAALKPVADAPVPAALVAAVLAADAAARAPKVVPMPARPRPAARPWVPMALAASVAALLAAPVGYWAGREGPVGGGAGHPGALRDPLAGAHALVAAALETTASGTSRMEGGFRVQPLATHPVAGGACRDFLLEGPAGPLAGLACREGGGWVLRAGVALERGDSLRAASADHPVIGAMLERLEAGPPLDEASEAALMRGGWR